MSRGERTTQRRGSMTFRPLLNISIGVLYMVFGCVIIFTHKFGTFELSTTGSYAGGGLLLVYGAFRIWRGWIDLRRKD